MNTTKNLNDCPDIDAVSPLSETDKFCLNEIAKVLSQHKLEGRFGITLLHKHFDISDDEIMLETQDRARRELRSAPVKMTSLRDVPFTETQWRVTSGEIKVVAGCAGGYEGAMMTSHYGYKD